jgi:predicted Zn finger-like uncharacterized protein
MLITCPSCSTPYQIAPAALGDAGRSVRCVRCASVWFAMPASEDEADLQDAGSVAGTAGADDPWAEAFAGADAGGGAGSADGFDQPQADTDHEVADFAFDISGPVSDDGDPVRIHNAPSMVPGQDPGGSTNDAAPHEDIETFAARRMQAQRRLAGKRALVLPAIILTLFALNAAIVGWRVQVVKMLPQTASLFASIGLPVNLRGLNFDKVVSSKDTQDGVTILAVEGKLVSTARGPVDVPRLRFAVRNAGGQEIYTWTALPPRSVLGPGETLAFRSRLASPPAETSDVVVRFFNRHDVVDTAR